MGRNPMFKKFLLAAGVIAIASPTYANIVEARLGASINNIDWTGAGSGGSKERAVAINGEILFGEPEFLKWALSPQPYLGGALNLEGKTSYGGGGLLWRQGISESFYIDFSFGLVIHDGTLAVEPSDIVQSVIDNPNAIDDFSPEQLAQFQSDLDRFKFRQQTEVDFGSRILFREQISIGYRWSTDWSAHIFAEHLSHGNILASNRPNEGFDSIGLRVSRHF